MRHAVATAALAVVAVIALALAASSAHADAPSPELMTKLAAYAAQFEAQGNRASYTVEGRMDLLDSDGKVDSYKEAKAHVDANGGDPRVTVIRFVEDGKDKTADAAAKARESDLKRKKKREQGHRLRMPVRADQQARYVFDQVETDASSSRARVTFVPKTPAEDTFEGSAWVDTTAGTIISAGFKLSRTPMFVDFVHFSVEFGAQTSLGPAASKLTVEGEGGILFFRKHFVVKATLSDYRIAP
jgi:hypothetical protein